MIEFTSYQAEMIKFFLVLVGVITLGTAIMAAATSKAADIIKKLKRNV